MKPVQIIGIVYLGIFPILPGCLCQLLEVFGVSVHDSSISGLECVITKNSGMPPCHCDHSPGNAIEIPSGSERGDFEWLNSLAFQSSGGQVLVDGDCGSARQDRAPPGSLANPSARRVFSGVYLL